MRSSRGEKEKKIGKETQFPSFLTFPPSPSSLSRLRGVFRHLYLWAAKPDQRTSRRQPFTVVHRRSFTDRRLRSQTDSFRRFQQHLPAVLKALSRRLSIPRAAVLSGNHRTYRRARLSPVTAALATCFCFETLQSLEPHFSRYQI